MEELALQDIAWRLGVALACGVVIGINRELHHKPAGIRTFGLVSLGAAVATLVMLRVPGATPESVSRVIQGVLTGIGFLGAGVILRREHTGKVAGLTTAAAVWLTSALGVAAGLGEQRLAAMALVMALVLLVVGGPLERLLGQWFGAREAEPRETRGPPLP